MLPRSVANLSLLYTCSRLDGCIAVLLRLGLCRAFSPQLLSQDGASSVATSSRALALFCIAAFTWFYVLLWCLVAWSWCLAVLYRDVITCQMFFYWIVVFATCMLVFAVLMTFCPQQAGSTLFIQLFSIMAVSLFVWLFGFVARSENPDCQTTEPVLWHCVYQSLSWCLLDGSCFAVGLWSYGTLQQRVEEQFPVAILYINENATCERVQKEILEGPACTPPPDFECPICLDGDGPPAEWRALRCGHHFHLECLPQWLHKSHCCPLCRFNLHTGMPHFVANNQEAQVQAVGLEAAAAVETALATWQPGTIDGDSQSRDSHQSRDTSVGGSQTIDSAMVATEDSLEAGIRPNLYGSANSEPQVLPGEIPDYPADPAASSPSSAQVTQIDPEADAVGSADMHDLNVAFSIVPG